MKISFVVFEDENPGVECLSAALKKEGHQVGLVFNPKQFNKAYGRNKFLARLFDWQKLNLEILKKQNPDMVGFSCVTATYQWALQFAKLVKQELNKPIIFGGTHPTLVPEIVMKNREIDIVCIGEGEAAIVELANAFDKKEIRTDIPNLWFRVGQEITRNNVRQLDENLDKYDADRELFLSELPTNYAKYAYYSTSRGCPFNCSFCGNEQKRRVYRGKGKYVRRKSVHKAISELKSLVRRFHTRRILFVDDVFTMNRAWLETFISRYRKEIGLPFTCFIHPKLFDEKLGGLLKDGGCGLVWYGIQTGSEEVRKKVLNRQETNEEIIKSADICRKLGLKFMVDHIFDIPFDTDIMESVLLYNRIRPSMLNCYNLLYFPSSKIVEHGEKAGYLSTEDVDRINRGESIVYQTGITTAKSKQTGHAYGRYALFLTCIPILPRRLVSLVARERKLLALFQRLPLVCVPLIKVLLNIRVGHGFLPFAVLQTEWFWIKKFIAANIRAKIRWI